MVADINTHVGDDIDKSENESIFHIFEIHLRKLLDKSAVVCTVFVDDITLIKHILEAQLRKLGEKQWARDVFLLLTLVAATAIVATVMLFTPLRNLGRGNRDTWCSDIADGCKPKIVLPRFEELFSSKEQYVML